MVIAIISLKNRPCCGFVITSDHILSVRQYFTLVSFWAILSFTKKHITFLRFVLFDPASLPLCFSIIARLLNCYTMFESILYPCPFMKYLVHKICGRTSSIPVNSTSVKLCIYFLFPWEVYYCSSSHGHQSTVRPLQSLWIAYDASTYHFIHQMLFTVNPSCRFFAPIKYFMTLFSFAQPSSSGPFTHVVRKATAVPFLFDCKQIIIAPLHDEIIGLVLLAVSLQTSHS